MWYLGSRRPEVPVYSMGRGLGGYAEHCVCYAESQDGYTWVKPKLGLVEYNGSLDNNIVDLPDGNKTSAVVILFEPEDPEPTRCYKMACETNTGTGNRVHVAFSADGLSWRPCAANPVGPFMEMAGIIRYEGLYIVNGHDSLAAHHPFRARVMASIVSADFVHWSPIAAIGMDRVGPASSPLDENEWNNREEIHLGASLWNRGNVVVGVYGQWHGHATGDRRYVGIDLGLALSHDGISFYEPLPGCKLVPAREQPDSPDEIPALVAGQGMTNAGEKTLLWYSLWRGNEGTGVRVAEWGRDRLGYLSPFRPDDARAISSPIVVPAGQPMSVARTSQAWG